MPAQILGAVIAIAQSIYEQAQIIEANEDQTKRLTNRVRVVVTAIQSLSQLPNTQQFKAGLASLKMILNEIKIFIAQFELANVFKKILYSGSYQEDFAKFNQRLGETLVQLNIGLSAQQLINQDQDRRDEQADREKIISKLDAMLAQQRQMFLAVQQSQFNPAEVEAIVRRQLASVEARIRQYAHPEVERPLLPKDLQVNFYDLIFEKKEAVGTLGAIYTGLWHEQRVTIKFVEQITAGSARDQFIREAQIMSRLHNDFITRFYGACFEDSRLCFLIQHMEKGNLEDNLSAFTLSERLKMAEDLARGLHYLHEQQVIHGNIKPKSVLINHHHEAKWSDFGLSQTQYMSIASLHLVGQETRWHAPECWQARSVITAASDIYSFGILLLTLMTGKQPYAKYTCDKDIIKHVQNGQRETLADIHPTVAQLIQACWAEDPAARPKGVDIVQILNKLNGDELYIQAKNLQEGSEEQYRLLEQSGKKNCARALNALGLFALKGLGGCSVDTTLAQTHFQAAANAGIGRAYFNLARMHEQADGVPENLSIALDFYRRALVADPGDTQCQEKIESLTR